MSAAAEFFSETVTTAGTAAKNLPAGKKINIQTTGDVTIAFWNPAANGGEGEYGATEAITSPGATFRCPNQRARLVAAATADVVITIAED